MTKNFIGKVFSHSKKGSLHRQLGLAEHEKIPVEVLRHIVSTPVGGHTLVYGNTIKVTHLLKQRANFLLNVDRTHR